jgi:hypothetical protein
LIGETTWSQDRQTQEKAAASINCKEVEEKLDRPHPSKRFFGTTGKKKRTIQEIFLCSKGGLSLYSKFSLNRNNKYYISTTS